MKESSSILHALLVAAALACGGTAVSAATLPKPPSPMTKPQYEAEKAQIDDQYKANRKLCDRVKGHAQDVCETEARGRADALRAELEAKYKPSPEASQKAKNVTADANYAVAKAKCSVLKDGAKDRCIKEAKGAREAAIRQAKVEKVQETGGAFGKHAASKRLPAGDS